MQKRVFPTFLFILDKSFVCLLTSITPSNTAKNLISMTITKTLYYSAMLICTMFPKQPFVNIKKSISVFLHSMRSFIALYHKTSFCERIRVCQPHSSKRRFYDIFKLFSFWKSFLKKQVGNRFYFSLIHNKRNNTVNCYLINTAATPDMPARFSLGLCMSSVPT